MWSPLVNEFPTWFEGEGSLLVDCDGFEDDCERNEQLLLLQF